MPNPWLALLSPAVKPDHKGQLTCTQDVHVSSLIELLKGAPLYIRTIQWLKSNPPQCRSAAE